MDHIARVSVSILIGPKPAIARISGANFLVADAGMVAISTNEEEPPMRDIKYYLAEKSRSRFRSYQVGWCCAPESNRPAVRRFPK